MSDRRPNPILGIVLGAAGVAAVLGGLVEGERPVVVVSGGNVGPEIASAILAGS